MREIKFRAWNRKDKKMIYKAEGDCHSSQTYGVDLEGKVLDLFDTAYYPSIADAPDFELMQFTGLTDKNGKPIYEGDIVQVINGSEGNQVASVAWDEDYFGWALKRGSFGNGWRLYQWRHDESMKVIGNIWENEDPLK